MIKGLIGSLLLLSSSTVYAQSCPVDVPNPIHIDKGSVSVYEAGKPKLLIDDNNNLFINGQQVDLNAMQQKALTAYSDNMQTYLPQMAALVQQGTGLALAVLKDVSSSFDSQTAFLKVQDLVNQLSMQAQQKFHNQQGEFVMPADVFNSMDTTWKPEFENAMQQVTVESISSVLAALADEMKNGDLDFSQMQTKFSQLKTQITDTVTQHSGEMKVKANDLCGSIEGLAKQEQQLQQIIPQLQNIPMFKM
ncbi:DUF2884 family protein [Photobacterium carnosum]|uniref:DUF2884 family protein n=1 Tax=Photobacterium carnosum TaxID=2023717 RepID=UPI001E3A978F|nr:DUF2884 family protein [Photobacterium carnosum]MCD9538329.1 DUF2884 family protein [Photobacterium carnosum]MCF2163088.1 DUF2884 family protein [Photobacterium carnosum]